jgi:hypothetical protein
MRNSSKLCESVKRPALLWHSIGIGLLHERRFYRATVPAWERIIRSRRAPFSRHQIGVITPEDADHAKALLEQRKFVMKFSSFRDVLPK